MKELYEYYESNNNPGLSDPAWRDVSRKNSIILIDLLSQVTAWWLKWGEQVLQPQKLKTYSGIWFQGPNTVILCLTSPTVNRKVGENIFLKILYLIICWGLTCCFQAKNFGVIFDLVPGISRYITIKCRV